MAETFTPGGVQKIINERDALQAENKRLRGALERIAKEPAPGSTISCRNIAKAALSGS